MSLNADVAAFLRAPIPPARVAEIFRFASQTLPNSTFAERWVHNRACAKWEHQQRTVEVYANLVKEALHAGYRAASEQTRTKLAAQFSAESAAVSAESAAFEDIGRTLVARASPLHSEEFADEEVDTRTTFPPARVQDEPSDVAVAREETLPGHILNDAAREVLFGDLEKARHTIARAHQLPAHNADWRIRILLVRALAAMRVYRMVAAAELLLEGYVLANDSKSESAIRAIRAASEMLRRAFDAAAAKHEASEYQARA